MQLRLCMTSMRARDLEECEEYLKVDLVFAGGWCNAVLP